MREFLESSPSIQSRLLRWFDTNKRAMPWRENPSPYAVLLSELMLQQTRVETVIPYFERFMARWPTLRDLADANEDDVLSEWAGLGYYSRARNLLKTAKLAHHMGGLPGTVAELKALPGVGPYTAGAIASIAFGVRAPLVDGNVERVLCRLDGLRGDPRTTANRKALWGRAQQLVPEDRPGDFNQSLMELGATVCTPRSPNCDACPVITECVAHRDDLQQVLPEKAPKKKPKAVRVLAGVAWWKDCLLLAKRPGKGLLAGMWELPSVEVTESAPGELQAGLRERLSVPVDVGPAIGEVVHVFTHRKQTTVLHWIYGNWSDLGMPRWYSECRWIPRGDLAEMGLSSQTRKTVELVLSKNTEVEG